jgi:hypothetical protein
MAMATLVPAGVALRDQINERWPKRDKASDGWIGDTAHAARTSDHNPDPHGWVHALDIDHDFGAPGDDEKFLAQLLAYIRAGDDHGVVSYIVHANRLAQATTGWRWVPRALDHQAHIHISFTHAAETHGEPFTLPIFTRALWDGHIPDYDNVIKAEAEGLANIATYRLACRLVDLLRADYVPQPLNVQGYPVTLMKKWQASRGYTTTGKYGPRGHDLIFG